MGTMLYNKGISLNHCYDDLNISNPEPVKEVHSQYVRAGANMLETNTFGANRYKLAKHELQHKTAAMNIKGAHLAREAAGEEFFASRLDQWGADVIGISNDGWAIHSIRGACSAPGPFQGGDTQS